eukprot:Em0013g909a
MTHRIPQFRAPYDLSSSLDQHSRFQKEPVRQQDVILGKTCCGHESGCCPLPSGSICVLDDRFQQDVPNPVVVGDHISTILAGHCIWPSVETKPPLDGDLENGRIQLKAGMYQSVSAKAAEHRKHTENDPKCVELGWRYIPLAVESYGAWVPEALRAFSQVATQLTIRGNTVPPSPSGDEGGMESSISRGKEQFDPAVERLDDYKERFDFYCVANGIGNDRKKALFLTKIGQRMFANLKLRALAKTCNFGNYLEIALRDQFVCGLQDSRIQRELLCVRDLTLEQALDKARSIEIVLKETASLQQRSTKVEGGKGEEVADVLKVTTKQGPRKGCFRCGGNNHVADHCFHKEKECNVCGKVGHLARVCRMKKSKKGMMTHMVGAMEEQDRKSEDSETDDEMYVHKIGSNVRHKKLVTKLRVNNAEIKFEVDTGAELSLIPFKTYKEKLAMITLHPSSVVLRLYDGSVLPTKGEVLVEVKQGSQQATGRFVVVDNADFQLPLLKQVEEMLQQQDVKWKWTKVHDIAVKEAKALVFGIGACLMHVIGGQEQPVMYASRSLSKTEAKYAQIEREALAIIFAIKKFHQYLYGKEFILVTDHKPLCKLFGHMDGIPSLAAARIQRWALLLSAYQYRIEYVPGSENYCADCMSRLPLPIGGGEDKDTKEASILAVECCTLPVTAHDIAKATRRDKMLAAVLQSVLHGRWNMSSHDLDPFYRRRDELSCHDGCVLWGQRVIIPAKLQSALLDELHDGHLGVVRMKELARSYIWWPYLDRDIEKLVATVKNVG